MYSLIMMMAMNGSTPEVPQFHPKGTTTVQVGSGCTGYGYGYCTNWGYGSGCPTTWSEGCVASTTWGMHPGCQGQVAGFLGGAIIQQAVPAVAVPQPAPSSVAPSTVAPSTPEPPKAMPTKEEPKVEPKRDPKKPLTLNLTSNNLIRSDVRIELPEGAKLYVNGSKDEIASKDGRFETPALPWGQEYRYSFKAIVINDGKAQEIHRQVTFKAGESIVVDMRDANVAKR